MRRAWLLAGAVVALAACTPAQIQAVERQDPTRPRGYYACVNDEGQRYGFSGFVPDVPAGCVPVSKDWRPYP